MSDLQDYKALMHLAGFKVTGHWEITNKYWPDNEHFDDMRRKHPWHLFKTEFGLIRVGRRKRVWEIDWTDTGLEQKVTTEDNVTSEPTLVHAWTLIKMLEYLTNLKVLLVDSNRKKVQDEPTDSNSG